MTLARLGRRVRESVEAGTYDEARAAELSERLDRYVPGTWAAS